MIKVLCFGTVFVEFIIISCVSSEILAAMQSNEERTIARVQRLDVSKLDPTLPKSQLASWLAGIVGPQSKISWEMNDCGEQSGSEQGARDIPTCVQAEVTTSAGWNVVVMIQIGTVKEGALTTPVIKDAFIQRGDQSFTAHSLSELAKLLKSARASLTSRYDVRRQLLV